MTISCDFSSNTCLVLEESTIFESRVGFVSMVTYAFVLFYSRGDGFMLDYFTQGINH